MAWRKGSSQNGRLRNSSRTSRISNSRRIRSPSCADGAEGLLPIGEWLRRTGQFEDIQPATCVVLRIVAHQHFCATRRDCERDQIHNPEKHPGLCCASADLGTWMVTDQQEG